VPASIDHASAQAKLHALGLSIDTLTPEQTAYLSGYDA